MSADLTWQYCRHGYDITNHVYAEDDADEVRAWDNDICILEVQRTGNGRWRITGSDIYHRFPDDADTRLFESPDAALNYVTDNPPTPNRFGR